MRVILVHPTVAVLSRQELPSAPKLFSELILERAGPVSFKTLLTGTDSFQTDSSNLSWKKSQTLLRTFRLFHVPADMREGWECKEKEET